MLGKIKNDYFSWLFLISLMLLLLEVLFFNKGLIFSLLVAAGMIYIGKKRLERKKRKFLFWMGILFLAVSILGMITFRFLVLAVFIYLLIQFANTKKKPHLIMPIVKEPSEPQATEELITREPLFKNVMFGEQKTPEHTYEWDDINIQTWVGDTIIDMSYTVLPEAESVIFIRNVIGKVQILIPYDLEVSVHHSVIVGNVDILHFHGARMFNQNVHVQTADYEKQQQKIKIVTSLLIGDIEVRRI
ncbi:cell wall-active antibiotics response protein [Bacillus sp. DNRA2]|uniref:cell wall-active antibiotics response protein LiaF n=1 Tax=Bacillus sp. DNRA2 TaxID=2723053 RepID=UPI00145C640B|nr:cell wall-active antibiotics response protein LiaF [Bacillus sp. DNRA2]NMD69750.1 cell wall-active antibiotics response protein [Bacillus sp. DNRA2]